MSCNSCRKNDELQKRVNSLFFEGLRAKKQKRLDQEDAIRSIKTIEYGREKVSKRDLRDAAGAAVTLF